MFSIYFLFNCSIPLAKCFSFIPAPDSYWDIEPERMEKNPGGYVGETDEKEQEKLLIGLLRYGCDDNWTWSQTEKSPEVSACRHFSMQQPQKLLLFFFFQIK